MTALRPSAPRPLLWIAAAVVLVLAAILLRGAVIGAVSSRIRKVAAERGLEASWRSFDLSFPATVRVRGLTMRTGRDTLVRAESLAVRVDVGSVLALHPRLADVALAHAELRRPHASPAASDTVVLGDEAAPRASAARLRRAAETLSRLLLAPARRLPELVLTDISFESADEDDESALAGARIAWLDLRHAGDGIVLAASGRVDLQQSVPFDLELAWGGDDRLAGQAVFAIPDSVRGAPDTLRLRLDGAVHQDRRARTVTVADGTRLWIGELPLLIGGRLDARGPRARFTLDADAVDERGLMASIPATVLGPLRGLSVRGSFDYRLHLDLDLARPDSVDFDADVIPHDLALDPTGTTLPILGLDQPFTASIHLPHGRVVTRELSSANPFYRPLGEIDSLLVHAVLANEDGGFFHHRGFNTEAVRLAIAANLKAGAYRRGAGTVTMQLARNLFLGHERTLSRKAQEVVLAWVLEHLTGLGKQRLLEIYLNIIEWGPDVHGAAEATRYYFDKDPAHVTASEALFLTTVVPAPSRWRWRFARDGSLRDFARAQMHFIGRAMVARGWLAAAELPPSDSLRVELRGPARAVLFPDSTGADSSRVATPGAIALRGAKTAGHAR